MLTHRNITSAAASITTYLEASENDVILNVLPLSFDYGLYQIIMGFSVGATIVLERSFAFPPMLLDTMVRERVTGLPIVPTIAALLLRHDLRDWDLSALRYITSTGAVMPPHISRACVRFCRRRASSRCTESPNANVCRTCRRRRLTRGRRRSGSPCRTSRCSLKTSTDSSPRPARVS